MGRNKDLRKMEQEIMQLRSLPADELILYKAYGMIDYEAYERNKKTFQIFNFVVIMVFILFILTLSDTSHYFFIITSIIIATISTWYFFSTRKRIKGIQTLRLIEMIEEERKSEKRGQHGIR
ncbi:hypothetical protein [Paenibacillus sp. FSL P4-0288]|uniref:hypothetical protein n=1 Tax=Paenibacillus sp. FSL P4-0288 TaxID=2921633 RepID=UPI0030F9F560